MKKLVLTFSLCAMGICWGQRNMDLMTMILSPADNQQIVVNQTTNFNIEMMNDGSENFLVSDSLYIYVTVDGMPLTFQPDNMDHQSRTGISISSNGTSDFSFPMAFTSGFEGSHDICLRIIPVNGNNEITETGPTDNTACVTIEVVANTAGLEDLEANSGMIYPNPAKESFIVPGNTSNVTVTDMNGSEILFEMMNGKVNCASWPAGCYFIRLSDDQSTIIKRIIVSH